MEIHKIVKGKKLGKVYLGIKCCGMLRFKEQQEPKKIGLKKSKENRRV